MSGPTFGGPLSKFSKYLEQEGYGISKSSFFGPIDYPVKFGPRGSFSLSYLWKQKNSKYLGLALDLNQLGEITGQNNLGQRVRVGFRSYGLGLNYIYGPRLTKLSIGPVLMLNEAYTFDFSDFQESKEKIITNITLGLKLKAFLYLWNKSVTYGNLGFSYLFSYAEDTGPFPLDKDVNGINELKKTKLNYGHGSFFFTLGIKLK